MRKRALFISLAVIILVPLMFYMVLRTAYVQNFLVQKVTTYLSEELETEVRVGEIDVTFFMNIVLKDVTIKDQDDEYLLVVENLIFDLGRVSFTKRQFLINKLYFENAEINIRRYSKDHDYNFRFLIDYFSGNIEFKDSNPWNVLCRSFEFKESEFSLYDNSVSKQNGQFNPGDISITNLNIDVSDIFIKKDAFVATLNHFTFIESKGFIIEDFSGDVFLSKSGSSVKNMALKTNSSQLYADALIDYESLGDLDNIYENVTFYFDFLPSTFCLADIGFFLSDFESERDRLNIEGVISGRLDNIKGRDFLFNYGTSTLLNGNFSIMGLPDYDNTFVNLSVNKFSTTRNDIDRFVELTEIETVNPLFYDYIVNLGNIVFTGNLTGFLNDFVAFGELNTDIGVLKSDIAIFNDKSNGKTGYKGSLATDNFNIGELLKIRDIGNVNLEVIVEGYGTSLETADLELKASISDMFLFNYNYQDIELTGNLDNRIFNGAFFVDDPNIVFDFAGLIDFSQPPYYFDFYANVHDAHLTDLQLYQRDSLYESVLSTDLSFNINASNLDDMVGEININNTSYSEISIEDNNEGNTYDFDNVKITGKSNDNGGRRLELSSGMLDVILDGEAKLGYMRESIRDFLSIYMPSWYRNEEKKIAGDYHDVELEYLVDIKDVSTVTNVFFPGLSIIGESKFEGYYSNKKNELNIEGSIPKFVYNNNVIYDLYLKGKNTANNTYVLETTSSRLMLSDSIWLDNFSFSNYFANDSISTLLSWQNKESKSKNKGEIESMAVFDDKRSFVFKFNSANVHINDSLWQVNTDHIVKIDTSGYDIDNLTFYKSDEHIIMDGKISKDPGDNLTFGFNSFDLSNFDWFYERNNIMFDGILSGNITIGDMFGSPNIYGDADVIDFGFNDKHLGDMAVSTHYDHEKDGFAVFMDVVYLGIIGHNKPIVCTGYYFPYRDGDNFDLDITVENLDISIFGRYLDSFAQDFRGMGSGDLRLEGPSDSPGLSGSLRLARSGFRVDYLNTSYTFAHELEIGKDYFAFHDMVLNDTIGNSAIATGYIYHDKFRNFEFDIEIFPDNLVLLNTTSAQNQLYYGKVFATGRGHIHGPADNIVMDIAVRTNRNTEFFFPLTYRGELKESSYISFVSNNDDTVSLNNNPGAQVSTVSGLALNFDLEVTPDAEVQLIFDSQIGDIIRGQGYGNLSLEITSQGAFNMYGEYTLEEGDYLFTLQNMINKRFRIEDGSSIRWSGDPFDAEIDLQALYRVRTALYDLVMEIDTSAIYRRRIPVDVLLKMENELFNPDISFDINLPQSDEATREMVDQVITTEQELNRQIFSLLVLNRFLSTNPERYYAAIDNSTIGYGVGMTSTEMLSNQISNWLSQISTDFDIGVNYRPGDEISSQELEVALSTQFFDDRLIIDGNVGVAGDHPGSEQRASNIIGDVNIEYKITPEGRFRVKAFNRSNTFDILNANALYTQGVGLFYRKEFDDINELFKRRKEEDIDRSLEYEE